MKGRDSLATDIHLFQSTRPKGIRITQLRTIAPIFPLPSERDFASKSQKSLTTLGPKVKAPSGCLKSSFNHSNCKQTLNYGLMFGCDVNDWLLAIKHVITD